jgi:hypothetical protein
MSGRRAGSGHFTLIRRAPGDHCGVAGHRGKAGLVSTSRKIWLAAMSVATALAALYALAAPVNHGG